MAGALLSFTTMALSIRALAHTLSIFEILTTRTLGGLAILLTLAAFRPELREGFRPRFMRLNLLRNSVHFASQYVWALSLTLLPLADVFALEFTMPVWLAILAVLILGETMSPSRYGVVVTGVIGVLVILRPGLTDFNAASLLPLAAAFGYAIFNVLTKKLSAHASIFHVVFWMNAMQFPIGLAGSEPLYLLKIAGWQWLAVAGVGIAGLSAHFCLVQAFRAGDATLVMPIDFLRVPLIAVIGWLFYGESLDIFVFLGAGIMLAGILWNLHDEAKKAQIPIEDP
jgi:drug/metabolite transporter (DMT)-like permease